MTTGETDLAKMLATLRVQRRPEPVTMVTVSEPVAVGDGIFAVVAEDEGTTVIATAAEAERRGWASDFLASWLTIEVHSSLDAVGLTAAMSKVLTQHQIPCNVVAGFYHDHLLVPVDQADQAIDALESLRENY